MLKDTGFDIVIEELRFFDYWLRGIDNGVMREPAVTYYTYNEAPERAWKSSPVWPLRNEKRTAFYLGDGALGDRQRPASPTGETRNAGELRHRRGGLLDIGHDIRHAPLDAGHRSHRPCQCALWMPSTATDADIIARIDDVAPDGTHTYVGVEGRLRASMRATAKPPYDNLGLPWHPFTQASRQPLRPGRARRGRSSNSCRRRTSSRRATAFG